MTPYNHVIINEKLISVSFLFAPGEITMQKVKVSRYVAGKRPEYAQHSDEEEDSDEEVLLGETFMRHRDIDDEEIEKVSLNSCLIIIFSGVHFEKWSFLLNRELIIFGQSRCSPVSMDLPTNVINFKQFKPPFVTL